MKPIFRKTILSLAVALMSGTLVGCGTTTNTASSTSHAKTSKVAKQSSKVSNAKLDVDALFTSDSHKKLISNLQKTDILAVRKEVNALPSSATKTTLLDNVKHALRLLPQQQAAEKSAAIASSKKAAAISESKASSEKIANSESKAASISESQQAVAESNSKSASRAVAKSASIAASSSRKAASQVATSQKAAATNTTTATSKDSNGQIYTKNQGKIVGNVNSHIYHVPGQAGYHMNASNAVYFNTEAEAQAQGYRKSLR
ncbi:toxin Cry1Ac domain D-VI-related protein [Lactiplantibacillus daowaiensis]|uniref:Toxin Cry1Ac domain D-VI-related protein n=1 Tax=Lactiplantibacillus daowaiensis TaxID=2559918 RepID=A0ABW1S387_9LACO|nr:toxin Cry1Ac domain D-VI-related protein [Lactiplantibacillus daowaiensis]